jgi:hypothetical protein
LAVTRPRKKASQPAPSTVVITLNPSISRCPSAFTPTAMTAAMLTMRPPSRIFCVIASRLTHGYGHSYRLKDRDLSTLPQ